MKRKNYGFTLAEMLIVVAIIGVLISIMVPTIQTQLEKAREATDMANIRNAESEIMAAYLDGDVAKVGWAKPETYEQLLEKPYYSTGNKYYCMTVKSTQKKSLWQTNNSDTIQIGSLNCTFKTARVYYLITFDPETNKWTGSPKGDALN